MTRGAVALVVIGLLCVFTLAAADPAAPDDPGPSPAASRAIIELAAGRGVDTLLVPPGRRRVCLSRRPIFIGTLEVYRDSTRLAEGIDYAADENAGCFEMFIPPADTLELHASYRFVPISARLRYQLHTRRELEGVPAAGVAVNASGVDGEFEEDGRLSVGGSKTFVVEIGSNRDAALRQSLDLSVRGRISAGVELQAVLSDRDSPVTPEGTSSEIEELDRVFVQVRSRTAEATFGDIDVAQERTEFARYERRLEGVRVRRGGERVEAGAVAANARGTYRTVELFGEEGKQGPYRLGDIAGLGDLVVVPGSDEVYLNGERLSRGQDRDYTIDYSLAELTFTPRRPITFDSRITVDFEAETDDYRRRFLGASAGYQRPGGGLHAYGLVLNEQDDRAAPRGFSIGADERRILEELGDREPVGEQIAARLVGAGNGDYVKDSATGHFEWVGPGNGDYEVSFVRVGTGFGSYADSMLSSGDPAYIFVGAGAGDFEPGRRLAPPEIQTVGDILLDWTGRRLTMNGEIAASRHDLNTFSPIDDGDNDGLATKASLELRGPSWSGGAGGIDVDGTWRRVDRNFTPLSRITSSFDFLSWNYAPGGLTEGEERLTAGISVRPRGSDLFRVETGRLRSGDAFHADRAAGSYRREARLSARVDWERTWSEEPQGAAAGLREVGGARTSYRLGMFVPLVRVRAERTQRSAASSFSGNRFHLWGVGAAVDPPGPLRLEADFERRLDDVRARRSGDEWDRASVTRDRGGRVQMAAWRGVSGTVEYRRRTLDSETAGASRATDLARLQLEALPAEGAARVLVDYQVTTEAVFPRTKEIVFVGDGLGNYDSLGVFVGTGDYDVGLVQADTTEILSRLDLSLRATVDGKTDPGAAAFWRNVRASSFVRVTQSTRAPFGRLVNPFDSDLDLSGDDTVEGAVTLRQEAALFPSARVSPRVRWERLRGIDGRFGNVRDRREEDVVSLRVRSVPRPDWTAEVEGTHEESRDITERFDPTYARAEETFTTRELKTELAHQPSPPWTVAVEGVAALTRSPEVREAEDRYEIAPRAAWTPSRLGRIEVRARWVEVRSPLPRRRPTFGFGLAGTSGREWSVISDFRLKSYLILAGTFRAVSPRGGDSLYDGRMELRAFF
jgi:hypothetical protein